MNSRFCAYFAHLLLYRTKGHLCRQPCWRDKWCNDNDVTCGWHYSLSHCMQNTGINILPQWNLQFTVVTIRTDWLNMKTSTLFHTVHLRVRHESHNKQWSLYNGDAVAARSKAWTVFARSNTGIVGSNRTPGIHVCVLLFCVCVILCVGSGLATGWSPVQEVLPTVYRITKLKKGPRSKGL
jgi:hypothetical protein